MPAFPVWITNPEKVLWPELGLTKADYLLYLAKVSPYLLAHVADRPLTLIRFPNGIHGRSFYQKDAPAGTPEWVKTVPVWSSDRKAYIHPVIADSPETLLWLGNMAALELHAGFHVLGRETPETLAFDLDPTVPGFEPVREVAMALHELLTQLGLPHVAKTSGATGLQVFLRLREGHTYEQTRVFTQTVAEYLQQRMPNTVTLERLKKNRGNKVYVDYLQHGESRTLIAAYSARATVHATASTPVTWTELAEGAVPEQFTVLTVPSRLTQLGDLMDQPQCDLTDIIKFLTQAQGRAR